MRSARSGVAGADGRSEERRACAQASHYSDDMNAEDPSQLRISDDDRHQVAEVLREAAGEGRIDLTELDERLEATYAARTYADLVPITLDLPVGRPSDLPARPAAATPSPVVSGPAEERHLAILGGLERKGVWTVPAHLTVNCFMGGADLDLRRAQFAARGGGRPLDRQ